MASSPLLASAARTASANSEQVRQSPSEANRGLMLILDVTATPNNTETLTPVLQVYDLASKKYQAVTTFAALTASALGAAPTTATFIYTLYPGAVETAATNNHEVQGLPIPNFWRAQIVHSAAGSWTYSLSYQSLS